MKQRVLDIRGRDTTAAEDAADERDIPVYSVAELCKVCGPHSPYGMLPGWRLCRGNTARLLEDAAPEALAGNLDAAAGGVEKDDDDTILPRCVWAAVGCLECCLERFSQAFCNDCLPSHRAQYTRGAGIPVAVRLRRVRRLSPGAMSRRACPRGTQQRLTG